MFDTVIENGTIVDGTRKKPYQACICVKDGIIAKITKDAPNRARHRIDASGLIVAPGFIDIHTHSDPYRLISPLAESKVFQGVTAELCGNCGVSLIPTPRDQLLHESALDNSAQTLAIVRDTWHSEARDVAQFARRIDNDKNTIHLATLIGHGTLRGCVMGFEMREPTEDEMRQMEELLAQMMDQGAFGLSLGLIYPPGNFCATGELIRLATVVKRRGGMLSVHMRNESDRVFEALDEMLEVAAKTGVHVNISHLKLMGLEQWGKAELLLEKIHAAQAAGLTVTADQYPYDASSTSLRALLPKWAHEGGAAAMLRRLKDPAILPDLLAETRLELARRGGPSRVRIAYTRRMMPEIEDLTLEEIAQKWNVPVLEAVTTILLACGGSVSCIFHSMSPKDVERIMKEMYVAVGSDGRAFRLDREFVPENPHRRNFGTFPMFLQTVREKKLMPIEDAVYKMTGLPAKHMGLSDRGVLAPGKAADITIFDFDSIRDRSSYGNSVVKPEGIVHVMVSGALTVQNGVMTEARNGRFLRFDSSAKAL